MNKRHISLTLIVALAYAARIEAQVIQSAPRLVVNITIDQLRSDYLEAFSPLYGSYGFKRLLSEGRVYTNASFPFQPIDRASAITAILTGATPYYNSIVAERWLDRNTLRPVYCVDDNKYKGLGTEAGSSPKNVLTSTIGDELKVYSQGKAIVYSIAPTTQPCFRQAMQPTPLYGLTTKAANGAHRHITTRNCPNGQVNTTASIRLSRK